jgi:arsenite methyltransferase
VPEPAPFDFSSPRDIALYDELPLWSSLAGGLLLDRVTLAGAGRVLDLGCGTGFPLVELAARLGDGAFVAGLDPWAEGLRRAHAKVVRWGCRAAVVRGDGVALPFRSDAFDLVVSNLGVNNFDDAAGALRECRRVLKPGGRLGLSSNLVGHMRELYAAFERVLSAAGDLDALARLQRHVEHRATIAALRTSLEAAGFGVTAVHEREAVLRFANAGALFSHHFIRLGFRPAWEEIATPEALAALRAELDRVAVPAGELRLTVPLAYLEARRIR